MPVSNPPFVPRYGVGNPSGPAAKGTIYFDTSANYTAWTFQNGQWNRTQPMLLGAGVPAFLAPAGFIFSRTDQAHIYSSQPTPVLPAVVQSANQKGTSNSGNVTFAGAVTTGNLLLANIGWNSDQSAFINTAAWTTLDFSNSGSGGNASAAVLYRYAQAGDGVTPPNLFAGAVGPQWAVDAIELSGVSGNIATDLLSHTMTAGSNIAANLTTPAAATTTTNQLALILANARNGTVTWAVPAGYTAIDNLHQVPDWALLSCKQAPGSGVAIGGNLMTKPAGTNSAFYAEQIIMNSGLAAAWTLLI